MIPTSARPTTSSRAAAEPRSGSRAPPARKASVSAHAKPASTPAFGLNAKATPVARPATTSAARLPQTRALAIRKCVTKFSARFFDECGEPFDNIWMFVGDVAFFGDVIFQVIKGGLFEAHLFIFARDAIRSTGADEGAVLVGQHQLPASVARDDRL